MPHDPDLTPGLTPDQTPAEEQIRRLLADARHTEPMPDDVAARLDGVLADLASEDGAGPRRASDHSAVRAADLAAARRRRTVRHLLVAAAAVVAIGIGINQADLTVTGDDANSESSGSSDVAGSAPEPAAGAEGQRDGALDEGGPESAHKLDSGAAGYQSRVVRLAADRFGAQVRRLQVEAKNMTMADQSASASQDFDGSLYSLGRALSPTCSTRGWGAGLLVPVRYDGDLGGLVFRQARGETQVVDLFLCGRDEPTRSITLPDR